MKKYLLTFIVMFVSVLNVLADDETTGAKFTIKTSKAIGETIEIEAICTNTSDAITVDWGDGGQTSYTSTRPWSGLITAEDKIKSKTITISGNIKQLEIKKAGLTAFEATGADAIEKLTLTDNELTGLTLTDMPKLTYLNLGSNKLESSKLSIDGVASSVTDLTLKDNALVTLDLRKFSKLNNFYASGNNDLTTVLFTDGATSLKTIDMSDCHIMHFYAISLPNLNTLNLSNNALIDNDYTVSFEDGDYPNLHTLSLSNNYISVANLANYPGLTSVAVNGNQLKRLNVGTLTNLNYLNCADNKLTYLNVSANKELATLICGGNNLTKLDITANKSISTLNISNTLISNIDLSSQYSLREFKAQNTKCASFNFNFVNPWGPFQTVDVRDNTNMTAQSLNMMFKSMPARSRESYSTTTLLISGCPGAEQSNTDYVNSGDMKWKTDVKGDNSANMDDVNITVDATNTGIQDSFEGSYDADKEYKLTKYSTDNGEFYIAQWSGEYYQYHADASSKAKRGVPAWVKAVPAEGYQLKDVLVNGKAVSDSVFTPVADATVKVEFEKLPRTVKFTTTKGTMLGFGVTVGNPKTPVLVNWGSGQPEEYVLNNDGTTYFDDNAIGDNITVSGDITSLIAYSFPDSEEMGITIDNKISAVDFSGNELLTKVDLYGNPIEAIDVSNLKDLTYLDVSSLDEGKLTDLNVGNNPKLTELRCYNNKLASLDLSHCPELTKVDAKNNEIADINLNSNLKLQYVNLNNNKLTAIDVTRLTSLTDLLLGGNKLTNIDVSKNTSLYDLTLWSNKLTQLDLTKNKTLQTLSFQNNNIHTLDLSTNTDLRQINCGGNGMSACDLDEFFWTLPTYPNISSDERPRGAALTLNTGNEDTPNDYATSDTSIATGKGWITNTTGDATGCPSAYVTFNTPDNGTIRLLDADNNEIKSGEKVLKNTTIKIVATPAPGYKYDGLRIDNTFYAKKTELVITKYTNIEFGFSEGTTGIDNVTTDEFGASVEVGNGTIYIKTSALATATVFNTNGKTVDTAVVNGSKSFNTVSGAYIVKLTSDDGKTVVKKVVVK